MAVRVEVIADGGGVGFGDAEAQAFARLDGGEGDDDDGRLVVDFFAHVIVCGLHGGAGHLGGGEDLAGIEDVGRRGAGLAALADDVAVGVDAGAGFGVVVVEARRRGVSGCWRK